MYQFNLNRFAAILAYQRSGTHFLGSCLDSHPNLRYVGEIFSISWPSPLPGEAFGISIGCPSLKVKWKKLKICLERVFHEFCKSPIEIVILDIKYNQMTAALEKLLKQIKVIHLIRRDLRKRYFSQLYWEKWKKKSLHRMLAMDIQTFEKNARKDSAKVIEFQRKFCHLENLRLYYEDLTQNRQTNRLPKSVEERICSLLKIEHHPLMTSMRKIAPFEIERFLGNLN